MKIPKSVLNLIESFEKLPGVGPKSAQRLTFYLLHVPQYELIQDSAQSAIQLMRQKSVQYVQILVETNQ
jgi:recombination protein RecR